MNDNIDAKLIVELTIKNCIDRETLEEYFNNDIESCIKVLLCDESLWGVVEDEYTILKVEEI